MDNCLKAKKFNLCPDVGYFGRYFANPRCEKPVKNWLLCVARENLRLKNSDIYTKIWLPVPKITKTRKLKTCFPTIGSICVHTGHKNKQKLTKTVCFHRYKFVQFVPQFVPRCRIYSFIISMGLSPSKKKSVRHDFNHVNVVLDSVLKWLEC